MHYIRIKQEYIDFLQRSEPRIPNQDYGEGHYKPFYILNELEGTNGDILYVTQLTSPKERHMRLSESLDLKKIYNPNTGKLLGATNLNYMFPVMPEYIEHLSLNDLKESLQNKFTLRNLAIQKKVLDKRRDELRESFEKIYKEKYENPDGSIARRSLDFKTLEAELLEFKLQEQFNTYITVERSSDHSTFFIETLNNSYEYSESILQDTCGFLCDMEENLKLEEQAITRTEELSV